MRALEHAALLAQGREHTFAEGRKLVNHARARLQRASLANEGVHGHAVGRAAAAPAKKLLALCKLCAVSADFCERQLQLLFTVLARARSPRVRALAAVALGDLAFRFPNLVEPYTGLLYARLRDGDARVRKNMLMVLTHLILHDMVKVKGQVYLI